MNKDQPFNDLPALPPAVALETAAILKKAIAANRQLAELKGLVHSIPNQSILVSGIVLQEARLSSEIENIITTNDELYKAATDEITKNPQAKEVLRYREALWHGYQLLKNRPLSTNLFIELVAIIKGQDIGIRRVPGTKIANARGEVIYTPPEGETTIREKLAALEKFIHAEDDIDPLIKLALVHYQFEAIHPFTDGNGRTGRIINILYLVEKGLLETPILFLSRYILRTKSSYYNGLRQVTENNAWEAWVLYMLEAVQTTALETKDRVKKILDAMEKTKTLVQAKAGKIYSKDLIEVIFQNPYCKIRSLEEAEVAKRDAASNYLHVLEELKVLKSIKYGREVYYVNEKLIKILST